MIHGPRHIPNTLSGQVPWRFGNRLTGDIREQNETCAAATFNVPGGLGERRLSAASSSAMAVAIIWPSSIVWSEKR